jgi:hypothetical protein
MIEYIKNRSPSSIPSEEIAGRASIRVWKMIEMAWTRLTILKIRPIRSVRSRVPRIFRSTPVSNLRMICTIQVPMTTIKSKMFHNSLKYFFFKAISLMTASTVKIAEKT